MKNMIFTKVENCECDFEWKNRFELYQKEQVKPGYLGKHELLSTEETHAAIVEGINSGKGFWASRFGENELGTVVAVLQGQYSINWLELRKRYQALCNNAGFFPHNPKAICKYVQLMLDEMPGIDLHGAWPMYMESFFKDEYFPNAKSAFFGDFEPYSAGNSTLPWSSALKGKKVLVIHPFSELIEEQYRANREKIFSKVYLNADDILPEFELHTLKAVQTIAGNRDERFADWFEALDWMTEQAEHIDFDVAIVGCGAYGFPLSARIKRMGKVAIQLCGATQIMFGIMGQRWEYISGIAQMQNEYWVRPGDREKVKQQNIVEEGCYW